MKFIQRKVFLELKKHLPQPEISLILGPRQAGKTTIMLKLQEELHRDGQPEAYFNLDLIEDRQYFTSQHTLVDRIRKTVGDKKAVIFIDEIQRLENAGLFLKGLYDLKTPYKFVVSGSGSLELKANIVEPMTGRKKVFYCLPCSFTEFVAYKLNADFDQVSETLSLNPFETERLISEYLTYGGYPRVVLSQTLEEKTEILKEIYQSYLEKDIQLLLGVEKSSAFEILVKLLASQVGNITNRAYLAKTCGLNEKTVEKYLFFLEKTFVINFIRPFFRNPKKELRKSPKVYFVDLGFLSLASGKLSSSELSGNVFENACFLRLKELELFQPIQYWRSSSGAEVDFILFSPKTGKPIPIEAKFQPLGKKSLGKSLVSFILKYQPSMAFIYTKNYRQEFEKIKTKIKYLPYSELPDIDRF